ncbi:lysophospholipid acyltransferase family protein [Roseomonas gilardii]|uniref:Lysophospholipid acyltransferase family protein n=1 Tax=Roseomonas gilardii TaxID=257708 RepID=A0ABU3MIA7_9PROT|nr:lysophospholipid acyltransferase family protein [Roseomonas gilardii]MDT8332114.1 lysophospholipid acyltransferase family protein [Roseomonas gilardii]
MGAKPASAPAPSGVTPGDDAPASPSAAGPGGRRQPPHYRPALPGRAFSDVMGPRPLGGRLRAVRRLSCLLLWMLCCMPVQAVLLALPGRGKIRFARIFWRNACRLFGLEVRVLGVAPAGPRALYLSNHSSWLDILVLGGTLEACFVAKAEVKGWPVIGTVAKLGRTIFVSRTRARTGEEATVMREHLAQGENLLLFPEGTSNDGNRVLPFRSSFLGIADAAEWVQPVSVVYDRLGHMPLTRIDRPTLAWYGDMGIAGHAWMLARLPGARVTVLLHPPVHPADFPNRKQLSARVERMVAEGAAALRQNRLPEPPSATPGASAGH